MYIYICIYVCIQLKNDPKNKSNQSGSIF
jgi:hypothetical protein